MHYPKCYNLDYFCFYRKAHECAERANRRKAIEQVRKSGFPFNDGVATFGPRSELPKVVKEVREGTNYQSACSVADMNIDNEELPAKACESNE